MKRFKEFQTLVDLTEMNRPNEGHKYEEAIFAKLKKAGVLPPGTKPAGSNSELPDAKFLYKGKIYNLELKLSAGVDYGSLNLNYNLGTKEWIFSATSKNDVLKKFYTTLGVLDAVNKIWGPKGPPRRISKDWSKFTKADRDYDIATFKDFYADIPVGGLYKHYARKDIFYLQVGEGKGFYYMQKNPAGLDVPQFKPTMQIRCRFKYRKPEPLWNYVFSIALKVKSGLTASPFDLDKSVDFLTGKGKK